MGALAAGFPTSSLKMALMAPAVGWRVISVGVCVDEE